MFAHSIIRSRTTGTGTYGRGTDARPLLACPELFSPETATTVAAREPLGETRARGSVRVKPTTSAELLVSELRPGARGPSGRWRPHDGPSLAHRASRQENSRKEPGMARDEQRIRQLEEEIRQLEQHLTELRKALTRYSKTRSDHERERGHQEREATRARVRTRRPPMWREGS